MNEWHEFLFYSSYSSIRVIRDEKERSKKLRLHQG